jgi:membrane protein DedA with SNARE-associated domain
MPDGSALLGHWGYLGIFLAVALGNIGLPVPEETILALAGYAAQRGQLHLPTVLAVGVISAVVGDNVGYWLGRRYGRQAIERYGRWAFITPERLQKVSDFMTRYGALAVFAARFVAGARFLAGPLAGAAGMSPVSFAVANMLGALLYVPYAVGIGYGISYGFGNAIHRLTGHAQHFALAAAVAVTLAFVAARVIRARHAAH